MSDQPPARDRRRLSYDSVTPIGIFAAAVILAAQAMLGVVSGIALLARVDASPLAGLLILGASVLALVCAFALVALRWWARVTAFVLAAAALVGWLFWLGVAPVRACAGIAATAAVIALLLLPSSYEAFARERMAHDSA